jgi:hypothetical protein
VKNDLVYVIDVYGKRCRISWDDYNNPKKKALPLYNQFGNKIPWTSKAEAVHLIRENISRLSGSTSIPAPKGENS